MRRRSTLIIGAGGLILLVGAAATVQPWVEALMWHDSATAVQAQRNAAAPQVVPVRPTATPASESHPSAPQQPQRTPGPAGVSSQATPLSEPAAAFPPPASSESRGVSEQATAEPTLAPAELQLTDATFQFQDPPQPGANVLLHVAVHNPSETDGGPISLDLPLAWLSGYRILGIEPLPVDGTLNGQRNDTSLRLTVPGPSAGDSQEITVYLVTTAEVVDSPDLRIVDERGRLVGRALPPTEAPPGAPGPVYAVDIPRLRLHAGVVQVDWEPPLFVVGQLRASAHVTEGNSVLVGHVRGAAGYNVFDHLDQLQVGDQVVASSRGQTYQFVVTERAIRPEDDTTPTQPTDTPRLTLMTCAGDWNPLTRDYPERLWVVAEPSDVVAAHTRRAQAPPPPPAQIAPRGGLGNTDADLGDAFGAPAGESATGLAVYRRNGVEHQAQLVDIPTESTRRAALVVERTATLSYTQAAQRARGLLPRDAQPRSAGPEGNARFVVERFSSAALAATLPNQSGDFLVVYARNKDGTISDIVVGPGDDPGALLIMLNTPGR